MRTVHYRSMIKLVRCYLILSILLFSFYETLTFAQQEESNHLKEKKFVLVLHSYHQGFTWTDRIQNGVEKVLFDYRFLEQFNIPLSHLPANSTILNKATSFYYKYKYYVWLVTLFIGLLISTNLLLIANIRKRKILEEELLKFQNNLEKQIKDRTLELENKNIELQESEGQLSTMAHAAQDAIIMMDDNGYTTFWNMAAEKIFGYTQEEVKGKDLHCLIAPLNFHVDYHRGFTEFKKTGQGSAVGKTIEVTALRKNGAEFPAEVSISSVKIRNKWNAIGIVRDLTVRKKLEFQLIQKEKASVLSTLIAGIAHEMNNPLMGVMNYIQYCQKKIEAKHKCYQVLKDAEQETLRCAKILENLSTFTHYEKEGDEPFQYDQITMLTERVILMLEHQVKINDIKIEKTISETVPRVKIKISQIQQVLINLMQNAIDALHENSEKIIKIEIFRTNDFVTTKIKDNGHGIAAENLKKIFDPFFTTKTKWESTGLGLSICQSLIRENGGEITCKSELGKGTIFEVLLPCP